MRLLRLFVGRGVAPRPYDTPVGRRATGLRARRCTNRGAPTRGGTPGKSGKWGETDGEMSRSRSCASTLRADYLSIH